VRILLANTNGADSTYGGAERYVGLLAAGLETRGHEVVLMSAFPVRDDSALRTITLHTADWRQSRQRRYRNHVGDWVSEPWARYERILRATRPDVVHTNNLPGISTGIWESARRLGVPLVHTLHDYQLLCPRTSLTKRDGSPCRPNPLLCGLRTRRLARWAPGVSVVVGVSEHVLRRHATVFPPDTARHVIRPPFVPIPGRDAPPHVPMRTVGFLGVLTRNKGVELLLEAAPALAKLGVALRIAGDGPLSEAVAACEHVRYEGRVDGAALNLFLTSCDAGVVPSLWEEPGPFVLCEWLSAGRPVIATRYGGLAEAARFGGVRSIAPTASALAAAVAELQDEAAWRQLLADRVEVADASDIARWVDQHVAAYETAVALPAAVASG
jgi:glycosyltransferase involved in cell wall biosynthesis